MRLGVVGVALGLLSLVQGLAPSLLRRKGIVLPQWALEAFWWSTIAMAGLAVLLLVYAAWPRRSVQTAESSSPPRSVVASSGGLASGRDINIGGNLHIAAPPRYTSEQVIELSNEPGPYNETLKLDNLATMEHFGEASPDTIEMTLPSSPPLTVDNPQFERDYHVTESETVRFPNNPGMAIWSARMAAASGSFVFHRFKRPAVTVEAEQRRFRVTLLSIRDKSTSAHRLVEYTFGIAEQ